MAKLQDRLRAFLENVLQPGDLEKTAGATPLTEALFSAETDSKARKAVDSAAQKLLKKSGTFTQQELYAAEAIILPAIRPAILIQDGGFKTDHPMWPHLHDEATYARITKTFASVGRVEYNYGYSKFIGTGFVAGRNLILTNRHVAEVFAYGVGASNLRFKSEQRPGIDFQEEYGDDEGTALTVTRVRMIHPYWDMAALEVEGLAPEHPILPISVGHPDDFKGNEIFVVGYPASDPQRNDPEVQKNLFGGIFNVKRLQPGKATGRRAIGSFGNSVMAATHDSSTLGGNSGSAVFDLNTGTVIGLHFAGLYLDSNFAVPAFELARDNRVVDLGVNFVPEGGRPDDVARQWWRGVESAPMRDGSPGGERGSRRAPQGQKRMPQAAAPMRLGQPTNAISSGTPGGHTAVLRVPLEITIRIGGGPSAEHTVAETSRFDATEKMATPIVDEDYSNRTGYDPEFLGVPVRAPTITDLAAAAVSREGDSVVPYQHFSVVMHSTRRLALFTASNVDFSPAAKKPEPGRNYSRKALGGLGNNDIEMWLEDPRVFPEHQLPDAFFTKDDGAFDKGHIVRRDDVAWGETYDEVVRANGDTYHTTNCSPQVSGFNQSNKGKDNWGDLEDLVARNAKTERLCVFAGPVLNDSDRTFVGKGRKGQIAVQIPSRFWKVIVAEKNGELQSFGFLLKQELSDVSLEFAVDGPWRRYMVSLQEIEGICGSFAFSSEVKAADQTYSQAGEALLESSGLELAGGMSSEQAGDGGAESVDAFAESTGWRVADSLLKLRSQINAKWPNRRKADDGTIGDAAHQSRASDHNPWIVDNGQGVVSALDITHDPGAGCNAGAIAEALIASRDKRIKYVIWNRKICSSTVKPWVWRAYTGRNPHNKHFHLSVMSSKALYDDKADWKF